jgi:hypothetical protein
MRANTADRTMKRTILLLNTFALLAGPFCSETLYAQKSYAVAIGGGVALPVGRLKDIQSTGYNAVVSLALGSAELPIGFRIDGIYNQFPGKATAVQTNPATKFRVSGALGNLIFAFPGTSVKTYAIVGGGLYITKLDLGESKSVNHPGLNGGAGLTFGLGRLAAFIEARYHFVRRAPANGGVIHFVPITAGILF